MKRALILLIVVFFLMGCASTLAMKGADGSTMTLSNYAITEIYTDGKLAQRVMVPDNSWFVGIMDKLSSLWQSVSGMMTGAAKTVIPAVIK